MNICGDFSPSHPQLPEQYINTVRHEVRCCLIGKVCRNLHSDLCRLSDAVIFIVDGSALMAPNLHVLNEKLY